VLFVFSLKDGVGADVEADSGGESFHLGFVADEGWLDEAFDGGFDGAAEGYVRKRPDDCCGQGWEIFAALDELVEYVVIGGMADERVDGYGFSQWG
jgi:hypothetical protein